MMLRCAVTMDMFGSNAMTAMDADPAGNEMTMVSRVFFPL